MAEVRAGSPAIDTFAVSPYPVIQQWFDDGVPHGRYHIRSEWLGELDSAAIGDVAPDATAFR
jgi:hypothetical protein